MGGSGQGGWDELYVAGTETAYMEFNYFNYLILTSVRCTQNCCVRKRGGAAADLAEYMQGNRAN